MLTRVHSAALHGVDAIEVEIEVDEGLGLPDTAVRESLDRVTTALKTCGMRLPKGRTTINLAPANLRKEGPSFDLPIALGMVVLKTKLKGDAFEKCAIFGELAPDGQVRPV